MILLKKQLITQRVFSDYHSQYMLMSLMTSPQSHCSLNLMRMNGLKMVLNCESCRKKVMVLVQDVSSGWLVLGLVV